MHNALGISAPSRGQQWEAHADEAGQNEDEDAKPHYTIPLFSSILASSGVGPPATRPQAEAEHLRSLRFTLSHGPGNAAMSTGCMGSEAPLKLGLDVARFESAVSIALNNARCPPSRSRVSS